MTIEQLIVLWCVFLFLALGAKKILDKAKNNSLLEGVSLLVFVLSVVPVAILPLSAVVCLVIIYV